MLWSPLHPSPCWASCNLPSLSGGRRDCLECLSECLGAPAAPAPHLPHPCSLQRSPVPAPGWAVCTRGPTLHCHTGECCRAGGGCGRDRPALTLPLYFAARGLCSRGVGAAAASAGPGQLRPGKVTLVQSSVLWGTQHGPPLTQPLFQVWRSDVHFARKQLLCPDGERGSWRGLGAVEMGRQPLYCLSPSLPQALWAAGAGAGTGTGGDRAAPQLPWYLEAK